LGEAVVEDKQKWTRIDREGHKKMMK